MLVDLCETKNRFLRLLIRRNYSGNMHVALPNRVEANQEEVRRGSHHFARGARQRPDSWHSARIRVQFLLLFERGWRKKQNESREINLSKHELSSELGVCRNKYLDANFSFFWLKLKTFHRLGWEIESAISYSTLLACPDLRSDLHNVPVKSLRPLVCHVKSTLIN